MAKAKETEDNALSFAVPLLFMNTHTLTDTLDNVLPILYILPM